MPKSAPVHYYLHSIRIHVSGIWTIFRVTTSCGNVHAALHANTGKPITMQIIGECIGSSKYMRCTSWMDEQCKYLQHAPCSEWIRTKTKAIANMYEQMIPEGFNVILHGVVRACKFSEIETNRTPCQQNCWLDGEINECWGHHFCCRRCKALSVTGG